MAIADVAGANFGQYTTEVDILRRLAEGQEAFDRQRHGVVDVEALRHIADAGIGAADQHPVMGTLEPEKQADKGRCLPAPFGPIKVTISLARMSMST